MTLKTDLTSCYLPKSDGTKYILVSITCFYTTRLLINSFTKAPKMNTTPSIHLLLIWLQYCN